MIVGQSAIRKLVISLSMVVVCLSVTACRPTYARLRFEGHRAMSKNDYRAARAFFGEAHDRKAGDEENLFDLGMVSMHYAHERFQQRNEPAALRELDQAIWYFSRAIESRPGMQSATIAKNNALELKGKFDSALSEAEWAAAFVGPSAQAYLYLASELEERGDLDAALLRHRQAVAIEPHNATAYAALGQFLLRQDRTDAAIEALQRAYELDPLTPGVVKTLTDLKAPLPRSNRKSRNS